MHDRLFKACGCGCGQIIELLNWDSDGADYRQPEGFYDDSCMRWFSAACGDSKKRRCDGCLAYEAATELIAIATAIRDSLTSENENPKAAHDELRRMVGVEAPLGRRLRKMIASRAKPVPAEACDPKTCVECRLGAA